MGAELPKAFKARRGLRRLDQDYRILSNMSLKAMEGFRKRVFDIDIEHCPHCGGDLTIIAAIEEPTVIAKILAAHKGTA